VVLKIQPNVTVVDVCHAVPSYDILDGAWTIAQAYRFFPLQTVHVVVVDPGVGSQRRPIIAETADYLFVAPDNGVLSMIEAREPKFAVRQVTAEKYFLQPVSQTFHGRDIFAALGGWLSAGVAPSEFGPQITDYIRLALPRVEPAGPNRLRGAVIKVDKFGNLITNISALDAPEIFRASPPPMELSIAGRTVTRLCHSYAQGEGDELFAIVGSSGCLEIATNRASAAQKLVAGVGSPVEVLTKS
jgi:S-adenosylmethionine hydrolase